MNRSESIAELTKAVIDFHKKVGKVSKDSENPFFKSSYASLSNILGTIQDPLNECGLTVMQFPEGQSGLTTILAHTSGEFIEETYYMTPSKDDPQGQGSAITYQRRYALGAVLSLNIDEDDDGNNASKPHVNGTSKKNKKSGKVPDDEKEWLNEGTKDWDNAEKKVYNGSIKPHDLRDYYKVSNANMEYFEAIEKKRQAELDEQFDKEKLEGTPF